MILARRPARHRRNALPLTTAALGALAVLLAGGAPAATGEPSGVGETTLRTASPTPVRAATPVAEADIDADGQADEVYLRKVRDRRCVVRVVTAAGEDDRVRLPGSVNGCSWHDAGQIDSTDGADLSVVTEVGAHTVFLTTLTWRADSLVVDLAPGRFGGQWVIDGAVNFVAGVRVIEPGRVRLLSLSADDGRHFRGRRSVFVYDEIGGWIEEGRDRVHMGPRKAARRAGWHAPGMERWPNA